MASGQQSQKIFFTQALELLRHIPGDTNPNDVKFVDMRDFENFAVGVLAFNLTGAGVTDFKILANTASDGSGTDVEIKVHALTPAPDADGDVVWLECTASEVAQEAADAGVVGARFLSANLTLANALDEVSVTYERTGAKHATDALTANVIA